MKKRLLITLATGIISFGAFAADIIVSDDGSGTGTTTWTNDNTYLLDGFVFVNDGQELTIQEGTVIKGMPGAGADASALVVARGGKIFAQGTVDQPIIFTFEADPLDGSVPFDTRGQWGGLIVLGKAGLNSSPGETQIEGIPETEPRGIYGGSEDDDDSGILTYVSVRHGGSDIGAGNEINGITLGGVGRGTIIDYVEVISNVDDGIEWFGGTVDVKHALVAFCGDDSFDYDEGWRGRGQFWACIQIEGIGDRGGEHDGGTDPEDGLPYTTPVIYNATFMGKGIDGGSRAMTLRDNAGGQYHNSIFFNWARGVDIENLASGEDSYARFEEGSLALAGNCFYETRVAGAAATSTDLFTISMGSGWPTPADSIAALNASSAAFSNSFAANNNIVSDPGLSYDFGVGIGGEGTGLGLVPTNELPAGAAPSDNWYDNVTYRGAFDPEAECGHWLTGWSMVDNYGILGCYAVGVEEIALENTLSVFPNPSQGIFTLNSSVNLNNAIIEVTNLAGQMLVQDASIMLNAGSNHIIDLSAESNGIYLVRIIAKEGVQTVKLIKE